MPAKVPYRTAGLLLRLFLVVFPLPLSAQTELTTFSRTALLPAGSPAVSLIAADANGDGADELLVGGGWSITMKSYDTTEWHSAPVTLRHPVGALFPVRLQRERRVQFAALAPARDEVTVYRMRDNRQFRILSTQRISPPADQVIADDLTNDARSDLLLFGRRESGIRLLGGRGDGSFGPPTTYFAEYSFSAVVVADFNSDGIADIATINWIRNELLLWTGFGRMKFSNPHTIPLPGESAGLCAADFNRDGLPDLLVSVPARHLLLQFENDGLGSFHPAREIPVPDGLRLLKVGDFNLDDYPDAAFIAGGALVLLLNDGKGTLREETPFAYGKEADDLALFRMPPACGAAVLDTAAHSIRLFLRPEIEPPPSDEDRFATGLQPGSVVVTDINRDGIHDLLVANQESGTLSLFPGRFDDFFESQIAYATTLPLDRLWPLDASDSSTTFLGSRPAGDSLAIVTLHPSMLRHEVVLVPTQGPIDLLGARIDSIRHLFHIFALERDRTTTTCQLVEFEQITRSRFLERTFTSLARDSMLTAAMSPFAGDRSPDLTYLTARRRQNKLAVCIASPRQNEEFGPSREIASFDVPEVDSGLLWFTDLNADGRPDILLNLGEPVNALFVALAKSDTSFGPMAAQFPGEIRINDRRDIQVLDRQPGRPKLLLINNGLSRMLQAYTVRSDGTLIPGTKLISTQGIGSFTFVPGQSPGAGMLFATDRLNGYLRSIPVERLR